MENIFVQAQNNKKLYFFIAIIASVLLFGIGGSAWWLLRAPSVPEEVLPTISFSSCETLDPSVLVVTDKQGFFMNNTDKIDHTLAILTSTTTNFIVKGREKQKAIADFEFGSGVYTVFCDGGATSAKIQVNGAPIAMVANADGTQSPAVSADPIGFGRFYDNIPSSTQKCVKTALGKDFQKAYTNALYMPDIKVVEKVKECTTKLDATAIDAIVK